MSPRTVSLRITTTPGMEDIVERELRERLAASDYEIELRPLDLGGQVMLHCDLPEADLREIALSLRSCFHVIRHVAFLPMAEPEPLEGLEADLADLEIVEMRAASRFRVTTQRSGEHEFGSMDAQRIAGAALVEHYGTAVDLEDFDTEVRVDAIDDTWLVGVQWTRTSLDRRYSWVYRPRVTLRTTIAYGLLRLAELPAPTDTTPTTVLDPFCGSGTILVEAASLRSDLRCLGADRDPEAVEGTRANATALGLAGRIDVREADARDLAESYPAASVDALVTNPPYGIRLGRRTNYTDLYRKFLSGAVTVLRPGGRLVVLVGKRRAAFNRAVREIDEVDIINVRVIEIGGVYPAVFVLKRA
ncbi:MAG: methyltransferase domain-containing protein [Spirochaetes bacterium]|nr:methyltransferase domain-containing protein [Spirochaetota bacterium]